MSFGLWATVVVGSTLVSGCSSEPPGQGQAMALEARARVVENATADTTLAARLYAEGVDYQAFMSEADERVETWQGNHARAVVPEALRTRASALGSWRILAIAEDWCGDSANTIPYLARLVESVEGLDMRIVDSEAGRALMERFRTPDDRAATPTLVVLDEAGEVAGCWVERPASLQSWYLEHEGSTPRNELLRQKYAWYDEDGGESTLSELVDIVEAARSGGRICTGESP